MSIAFPTAASRLSTQADAILKSAKTSLDWKPVDTDTMPAGLANAYAKYREAARVASELRQCFEDEACGPIGRLLGIRPGQDVAFGYKFGKLSVALTDKATPRAAANALRF